MVDDQVTCEALPPLSHQLLAHSPLTADPAGARNQRRHHPPDNHGQRGPAARFRRPLHRCARRSCAARLLHRSIFRRHARAQEQAL